MEHPLRWVVPAVLIAGGVALIAAGVFPSRAWITHHFLPDFSMSNFARSLHEGAGRALVVFAGVSTLALALLIRRCATGPDLRRLSAALTRNVVAAAAALAVCEFLLTTIFAGPFDQLQNGQEPARHADERLGWINDANRTGVLEVAERRITYVIDGDGDRVADIAAMPDKSKPTLIFTGESILFGYKLPWEETVAAQVSRLTGVQSANLAVEAYSDAQAYMRLADRLPAFERPVAIVSIFMPSVFRKTLDRTRPGLDAGLDFRPAEHHSRLTVLAHWLFPYESDADIAEGVATAQAIIRATAALAHARGATALTLVPRQLPESAMEAELRRRVLDDAGLPYLLVDLQPDWKVTGDSHPDARGDAAMARAIAQALRTSGVDMARR